MDSADPFHHGERALQLIYGSRERLARDGARLIRPALTDQHRDFFSALNYVFAALPDATRHPIPVVLTGEPGFVRCPVGGRITIRSKVLSDWRPYLRTDDPIALLGIDFSNRRRNRVNGFISKMLEDSAEITVTQAYGNCAKYIRQRYIQPLLGMEHSQPLLPILQTGELTEACLRTIASAETIFLATSNGCAGPTEFDISHRGGPPGFLGVTGRNTLQFPDFKGNGFFNSLGNLALNPAASVLIFDFELGISLRLQGTCRLVDNDAAIGHDDATTRACEFNWTTWETMRNPFASLSA